jgi:uncharacterized protein with PhoU and TrkA domain
MGGHPVTPRVLALLNTKFNGKAVTLDQLVAGTGLDGKQIQSAMSRLVADTNISCTVVNRGQMWKYDGPASDDVAPTDTLFEVVGTAAKGGDTIVRGDHTGKLYKVVAL